MRGQRNASRKVSGHGAAMGSDVTHLPPRKPELKRNGHPESKQEKDSEEVSRAEHDGARGW
jgi:hypothetical protein